MIGALSIKERELWLLQLGCIQPMMGLEMVPHQGLRNEPILAQQTLERFLLRMRQNVRVERLLLRETLTACLATERSVSRMNTYVFIKIVLAFESFAARRALERFLIAMHQHVQLQMLLRRQLLMTNLTFDLLVQVDMQVPLVGPLRVIHLAAVFTFPRDLVFRYVRLLVRPQRRLVRENLVANLALIGKRVVVLDLVQHDLLVVVETGAAHVTVNCVRLGVRLLVLRQR